MICFPSNKEGKPKPVKGAPERIDPWRGCWAGDQNSSPRKEPTRRSRRVGAAIWAPFQRCTGIALPGAPGQKAEFARRSLIYALFAFSWRGGPVERNQGRTPA